MEAGYTSTIIHEAVVSLEAAGFIIRVGGMYRVSCMPEESSCPPKVSANPVNVVNVEESIKESHDRLRNLRYIVKLGSQSNRGEHFSPKFSFVHICIKRFLEILV
jgi:hypothetical protein